MIRSRPGRPGGPGSPRVGGAPLRGGTGPRRRPTLASRTALVTTAVAAVAVLVAGLVSLGLVRSAGDAEARRTLAALADAASDGSARAGPFGRPLPARQRTRAQLADLKIDFALLGPTGDVLRSARGPAGAQAGTGSGLAAQALDAGERARVAAGTPLSLSREIGGRRALVEARPTAAGGLVLAQPLSEASIAGQAVGRIGLAMLVGLAVAALAGLLLARLLARPLRRAAHAAHAMAAGARDVRVRPEGPAEVAEVADSLNSLSAALAISEGRQREFLLSVSHELRTPLTAITGFAESLADGVTTGDDVRPVGRTVLGEARRLERLVSDLLDLARLGAQDFRIDRRPVELRDLVAAAADVWRARCHAVDVAFAAELPDLPLVTVTDPTRVRQILDGLAENALRVTPAGAPVVLALRAERGQAELEVRDGGPGLTAEDCAIAFERSVLYERYRGVRQVGTGVGLALVHGLTSRLGGSAEAGRAAEGGARFTVRLPLVDPAPYADTTPIPTESGASVLGAGSGGGSGGARRGR
jgi:signal transduction histidine kinase